MFRPVPVIPAAVRLLVMFNEPPKEEDPVPLMIRLEAPVMRPDALMALALNPMNPQEYWMQWIDQQRYQLMSHCL
jgi:hypothetical protein